MFYKVPDRILDSYCKLSSAWQCGLTVVILTTWDGAPRLFIKVKYSACSTMLKKCRLHSKSSYDETDCSRKIK